jgi:hypothetical protein
LGACKNFPRDGGKHNEKQYLKDDLYFNSIKKNLLIVFIKNNK